MYHYLVAHVVAFATIFFFAFAPAMSTFGQSAGDNLSAVESSQDGFVKRDGTRLTLNNRPYKFTGLNISNAATLDGLCRESFGTGEALNAALTEIDKGSGSRAKVFRFWFFQRQSTRNGVRDWSGIDHTIAVAKAKGFKIIPVLGNQWWNCDGAWSSAAAGYKYEQWYSTNYKTTSGSAPGLPQSYRDYVRDVVTRYKDEPTIAFWQLMNEAEAGNGIGVAGCAPTATISLRNFTNDMGALVKGIDSNHLLSLGTIGNGQCGATGVDYQSLHASPYVDLCEYHDYGDPTVPMPGDQWNGLQLRINQCNAIGKPMFIGETGIASSEVGGNLQTRANQFEAKFAAQFGSGITGSLVWIWTTNASTDSYSVKVGDPTLAVLSKYGMANVKSNADFDGDGKSDVSVFRPSNGAWYLNQSTNGFTGLQFGVSTDKMVPADYDGDGKTDIAVYRGGTWYLQRSQLGFTGVSFGESSDIPQPADYDGDGKADQAVFRPSTGAWYLLQSTAGFTGIQFGQSGDKPVAADYDGDGKTDVAVNRNGIWYIQRSQLGFTGVSFGEANDTPTPADYDGDGKADIAVFRPSNGTWYLNRTQLGFTGIQFGAAGDLPVAADYDGDGKADTAVFRNGAWYLNRTQAGFTGISFGADTDKPVPNAFVP